MRGIRPQPFGQDDGGLELAQHQLAAMSGDAWRASLFMNGLPRLMQQLRRLAEHGAGFNRRARRALRHQLRMAPPLAALLMALQLSSAEADLNASLTVGGGCSLADAISAANTNAGGGVTVGGCTIGAGVTDTLSLAGASIGVYSPLPVITEDLTIEGDGATLDGQGTVRVLEASGASGAHVALTVNSVTITGGSAENCPSGGAVSPGMGAAICSYYGDLTLEDSTISGNSGGVAVNHGDLSVSGSTVSGNTVSADSAYNAGLYLNDGALSMADTEISNNELHGTGTAGEARYAGLFAKQTDLWTISGVTVSGNLISAVTEADFAGAAVYSRSSGLTGGTFSIQDSTITGNSALVSANNGFAGPAGADLSVTATSADLNVSGLTVANNYVFAPNSGNQPGLSIRAYLSGGSVDIADSAITGNTVIADGTSAGYYGQARRAGATFVARSVSEMSLSGVTVTGNYASGVEEASEVGLDVRARSVSSGTISVLDSIVSGNTAVTTLDYDQARASDAGLLVSVDRGSADVLVSGVTVSANLASAGPYEAREAGAYIYVRSNGSDDRTLSIQDSIVSGNSAIGGNAGSGGEASIAGLSVKARQGLGAVNLSGVTVSGNYVYGYYTASAAGLGLSVPGNVSVLDSTITGNTAANSSESDDDTKAGGVYVVVSASYYEEEIAAFSDQDAADLGRGLATLQGDSSITIESSQISDNSADLGGGIFVQAGYAEELFAGLQGVDSLESSAKLTILESTISGNSAEKGGGAYIYVAGGSPELRLGSDLADLAALPGEGVVNIEHSLISGNSAAKGGGIFNTYYAGYVYEEDAARLTRAEQPKRIARLLVGGYGPVEIHNSTITGNIADDEGGGIYNAGYMEINNLTLTDNEGGGLYSGPTGDITPSVEVANSILADQSTGSDCSGSGTIYDGSNLNMDSDGSCIFSISAGTASLAPLSDNGGPTLTHLPDLSGDAVDAGSNASCEADDQRFATRPLSGPDPCDLGAVEAGAVPPGGSDGDGDGVEDSIEDAGPDGGGAGPGDANGDGIFDKDQADVASLPNAVDGKFITLDATSTGGSLTKVSVKDVDDIGSSPPGGDVLPVGLVEFELTGLASGATVTLDLLFEAPIELDSWWKYEPTVKGGADEWFLFGEGDVGVPAGLGAHFYTGVAVSEASLTLKDGALGDEDFTEDGTIIDATGGGAAGMAVELIDMEARRVGRNVHLNWETLSEIKHAGFHVYRVDAEGEERRVNRALIEPKGGELGGGAYHIVDWLAPAGPLKYWIEDVDALGNAERHGPLRVGSPAVQPPADPHGPR